MGLENRFRNDNQSSKGSDDLSKNNNDDANRDMNSDGAKNASSGSDAASSGGDGFKDKVADKAKGKAKGEALKNIPGGGAASGIDTSKYADNLQDVVQGRKSKEEAAKDVAKQAAKDAAREGLKQGAKAAAEGLGHGLGHASPYIAGFLILVWLKQKLDRMMYYMISSVLNNPLITWISNAIGAIAQASGFFHAVGQAVVGGAKMLFGGISHLVGGVVHGVSAGLHMIGSAVSGLFSSLSGSSAVGAVTGFIAQVAAVIVPIGLITAVGTALFSEPKQSDSAICTVLNDISSPSYGKLGKATFYKGDPEKTARSIYGALRTGGYTAKQAAGILGNLSVENTTFDPKVVAGDGSGATGIAQWQDSRLKSAIPQFAKKVGTDNMFDLNFQLAFLDNELQTGYKQVLDAMNKSKDAADAARVFNYGNLTHAEQVKAFGNMKNTEGGSMYYDYNSALPDTRGYEGSADRTDKRPDNAKSYYDKFANSKTDGSDSDAAAANDVIGAIQSALGCNQTSDDDGDTADWSGTIKESIPDIGMHWSWDDVPSDIKKYIYDPEKVGMKFNKMGDGWNLPADVKNSNAHVNTALLWQCVTFAQAYFLNTHKNMSSPKDWVQGNGGDIAQAYADKFGGKVTHHPNAGAVASAAAGTTDNNLASGDYGHVFVVTHVLKNGDIIGLEENMGWGHPSKPLSGTYNYTAAWDVVVLKKSTYTNWGIKFYTPDASKYPAKWSK